MIEAVVLLLAVGFSAGAAYIVGSRRATEAVLTEAEERIAPAAAKDVIEELLVNPDTAHLMKQVVRDYAQGRRRVLTGGFKVEHNGKKAYIVTDDKNPAVLDETPVTDEKFVIDTINEHLGSQDGWEKYMHPKPPIEIDYQWFKKLPNGNTVWITDEEYQNLRVLHGLEPMPPLAFRDEVDEEGNPLDGTSK
jgi:hypothetical protein